jgi:hypothetical protein
MGEITILILSLCVCVCVCVCMHAYALKFPVKINFFQKDLASWVPVAHACNPSYSEGRDQEHCSLKPAWANGSCKTLS